MTSILALQALYGLAGFLMNALSGLSVAQGRRQLTPTPPRPGMIVMGAVLVVVASYFLWQPIYALGWIALIAFVGPRGVSSHFRVLTTGEGIDAYASRGAAATALAINAFGMVVGVIGLVMVLVGWF